ncbi:MAG: DUF6884 domain-containing protein [Acidiferrobacter sp.]
MRSMVLIACVKKKRETRALAKDLYMSPLFRLNFQYACSLQPDRIFILSALYGLVDPEEPIEPYNVTLKDKSPAEIRDWALGVANQLRAHADVRQDRFTFLAGETYRKPLIPYLTTYDVPMVGLPIGRQLQYLKRQLSERNL